jgi:photosystem II stability/assembly factor-like uncharacterized protein
LLEDKTMTSLLVGTRKGLFVIENKQITSHHFHGEPVSQVLINPHDQSWLVALNLGHFGVKLHKSVDEGKTWSALAAPAFPAKPVAGDADFAVYKDDPIPWNVELIWSLAAGGANEPNTLWTGCMPAGLFKSTDGGQSWALNMPLWRDPRRQLWMGGGNDFPGIHSIVVDPRQDDEHNQHLTLGISCGGVWQTFDGGNTWTLTAKGMKSDYTPPEMEEDENLQDPHCVVGCASQPDVLWAQHHCGIYRSADGGNFWQQITTPISSDFPSVFGFAVAADPANPLRAWFVPAIKDEKRYPVGGKLVVTRTDDGGKTFQSFSKGLPQTHAYDLIYRHGLAVAPNGQDLAMASTTGSLWTSNDAGESWETVSANLPPVAVVKFI